MSWGIRSEGRWVDAIVVDAIVGVVLVYSSFFGIQ